MRELTTMLRAMLRRERLLVLAALLLTATQCALELWLPRLMADTVDLGILRADPSWLGANAWRMLAASAALGLAGYGASVACTVAGEREALRLRGECYARIQRLSVQQVASLGHGSLITRLTVDVEVCAGLIQAFVLFLAEPVLLAAGGIGMMWLLSRRLGLVFAVFVLLQMGVMLLFIRLTARDFVAVRERTDRLNGGLADTLRRFVMIKAFNAQQRETRRFEADCLTLFTSMYRAQRKIAAFNPLIMLLMNLAVAAVLWLSGAEVSGGQLTVGAVLSAINYSEQVLLSLAAAGRMYKVITQAQPSAARLLELLRLSPALEEGGGSLNAPWKALRLEQVDYDYPDGTRALRGIDFTLRAGELLAVVGPVGSGKSTLAALCARLADPSAGRVLVNETPLPALTFQELRRVTALVDRHSAILEGSVRENLLFGREGIGERALRRAIETAQLTQVLEKTPEGLQTYLRSGGGSLSGGERQRLVIARALAGEPALLLLDDSTSSLDYETERRLLRAIRENYPAMAVLLVTNRAVSAALAERILVLDNGRVAGIGSDSALRQSCPLYQRMSLANDEAVCPRKM